LFSSGRYSSQLDCFQHGNLQAKELLKTHIRLSFPDVEYVYLNLIAHVMISYAFPLMAGQIQ
jgi:hypothetical protein